jgi:hypothetical protein
MPHGHFARLLQISPHNISRRLNRRLRASRWHLVDILPISDKHRVDITPTLTGRCADISLALCRRFTNTLQTFCKHFAAILQAFHRHFTNILQPFHSHFTNISQPFYSHFTAILQIFYGHFTSAESMFGRCCCDVWYTFFDVHQMFLRCSADILLVSCKSLSIIFCKHLTMSNGHLVNIPQTFCQCYTNIVSTFRKHRFSAASATHELSVSISRTFCKCFTTIS